MKKNHSSSQKTIIRPMKKSDTDIIAVDHCPPWSTTEQTIKRWNKYLEQQQENLRTVGIVEQENDILGYGSLLLCSEYPYFLENQIPEINDVWIYEQHRGKGYGTNLIAWLENLAREKGYNEIGIGVGLYKDYGPAQKLYYKLGYVPDGNGVTYKYQPTTPGESYILDDELILWLKKSL